MSDTPSKNRTNKGKVKLGDLGAPPVRLLADDDDMYSEPEETGSSLNMFKAVALAALFAIIAGVVAFLVLDGTITIGGADGDSAASTDDVTEPPTFPLNPVPTPFPTANNTRKPTRSPTPYPTGAPTAKATPRPTFSPSVSPTLSPFGVCIDDEVDCGCDQVRSELVDIIFLVDESGSVGTTNYNLMKEAIVDFAQQVTPPMNPTNGTRIGYLEFATNVNEVIDMNRFASAGPFISEIQSYGYSTGGTDHRKAFDEARSMINREGNAVREGAQLAIVMLTDGNPCAPTSDPACTTESHNGCCSFSESFAVQADILKDIKAQVAQNFTFFFLPINPPPGFARISLDMFDAAKEGDGALTDEEFITFQPQEFTALNAFLNGDEFQIPLGPCVNPPTVSTGGRRLLQAEAGDFDGFGFNEGDDGPLFD